jgi:ABC-type nitrate/sulfonate/bicarbonate transport system substrate-binding protein
MSSESNSRDEYEQRRGIQSRREVIAGFCGAAIVGVAGCASDDTSGTDESNDGNGDQEEPSGTGESGEKDDTETEDSSVSIQFSGPQGAAMTLPTRLIRDEGFAANRGLDLTLELQPPPAIQQAIFAQEVESGTFPVMAGARAINEGRNVRLLGPVCRSFNSIVVRSDAGIGNIEELRNATLGSMPRSSAPWTHWAVLVNMEGLDHESYEYRFSPPAALFGAIQQGDLDAIIGVEPFTTRLLETGDFEEIYVFNDRWEELTGRSMPLVEVATYQETIDEKPAAVKRLMNAMFDAGEHIGENSRPVIEQYEEELGLETESQFDLVEDRIGHIYPDGFDEELRASGVEVVEKAAEFGLIDADPAETMFVDPREL